ncbi:MAG: hypothetical protein HYR85_10265, partial [Planctomycetes bacterium]|nr:hypothetical protein [Planctomycetota bacterium]
IVVPPPSRAVQVGAALERARGGDVLGALADARQAGADPDDIAFLESLAKLSDDVLEAERKADRNLPVKGKTPAVGKVARFDANSLVLADAKGKEIVLPRSAFGPDQVLDRVRSKQLDVGNPEILASTMALVGRSIADASPKVRDRAARWAATTRELDARNRVARLAPVVTTPPADVAPCLEDIDALLGTLRDTESVRANPTGLAALGTRLLETSYAQSDDVLGAFKGKAKRLPDGRVEVKFDDASSLAGFVEDKGYGERLLRGAYGIEGRDKHLGETSVAAGTLVLDGADAVFHPIGFSAPCTIEFELNMIATRDPSFPNLYFQAIAFDDSRGAWCGYNWAAAVVSPGEHRVVQDSDEDDRNARSFEYDFLYRFKLDHDGKSLSLLVNGVSKGTIPNASVKCGRVGFVVCGPARYQISKLVVRGMVDVSTLTERRAAWVARRTAKWQGDAKH